MPRPRRYPRRDRAGEHPGTEPRGGGMRSAADVVGREMASENELERRRDELQRIVYGSSGEPPAAVVDELAEVQRALAGRDGGEHSGRAVDSGRAASNSPDGSPDGTVGDSNDQARARSVDDSRARPEVAEARSDRRRPRRFRGLAVAVAALLLLAGGWAVLTPVRAVLSPPGGLGIFERAQSAEEQELAEEVVVGVGLNEVERGGLRAVGTAVGHEFWVLQRNERVCMLSRREFFFDWVSTCVSLEAFREHGLERRIPADEIRGGARPPDVQRGDVVIVSWGPGSVGVDWRVEPVARRYGAAEYHRPVPREHLLQ
ncbi:hypothetical protein DCE94_11575 [Agromyces badenianii]|nr:hypothetical protein DCE94_11575 [Agromyces badenianii]